MKDFLFGPFAGPKTQDSGQTNEEMSDDFDPNEESLSEGGEYMDDSLRMVEQPLNGDV
jgi:hypothetical protein